MFSFASAVQVRDGKAQLEALHRSQAVIEFALDGTILSANKNFLDTLGYEAAEVVGRHHRIFVDPQERESTAYEAFWSALRQGEYRSGEFRRYGKGGREVWIEASYNPVLDRAG